MGPALVVVIISVALLLTGLAVQGFLMLSNQPAGSPKKEHQNATDDVYPTAWALMNTSSGQIAFELYGNETPITTGNFINLSNSGYYAGTIFHRVLKTFVIQGGGYSKNMEPKEVPFPPIKLEISPLFNNTRGTISMARTSDPDSATTQFFINTVDNSKNLGPGGVDSHGYAVFGRVIRGMDVVDAIANGTVMANDFGETSMPMDPVEILSVSTLAAPPG